MSGAKTVGDLVAMLNSYTSLPPDICEIFNKLTQIPLALLTDQEETKRQDVDALLAELKYPDLFIERELSHKKSTLQQLGDARRLTRERIRQIVKADTKEIRRACEEDERHARLRWASHRVRTVFGTAIPLDFPVVEEVLREIVDGLDSDHHLCYDLVLFLAGPYKARSGLLTCDPKAPEQLESLMTSLENRHGIVSKNEVAYNAVANGFTAATLEWMLRESPLWLELDDGDWTVWPASQVDRSEVVLRREGIPMTTAELLDHLGLDHVKEGTERTLRSRLYADSRFIRRDKDGRIGLVEWGGERYEGIAVEIQQRIERGGGRASVAAIIDEFVREFAVAESSVRRFMKQGPFVVSGDDIYLMKKPRIYHPGSVAERSDTIKIGDLWGQRLQVYQRHIDGYSFALSRDVASHNGVMPSNSLIVPVTWNDESGGEASIIWSLTNVSNTVYVGRLSSVLRSHNIIEGDELIIAPSPQRCVIHTSDRFQQNEPKRPGSDDCSSL